MWWSLPDVYAALRGHEAQPYGIWRDKKWSSWANFIDKFDFGRGQMLTAPGRAARAGQCEYPWAAISTRCLLALCARWCCACKQRGRIDHIAVAARQLLDELCSDLGVETLEVVGVVTGATPESVVGMRAVQFDLSSGVLALSAAKTLQPQDFRRFLPGVAHETSCTLAELILAAPAFQSEGRCRCSSGPSGRYRSDVIQDLVPNTRGMGRVSGPRPRAQKRVVGGGVTTGVLKFFSPPCHRCSGPGP